MIGNQLSRLRIVVLAAGYSTRMGRSKAFLKIGGVSLIRRTIRTLAPFAAERIIVVMPPRARRMREELRGEPVVFVASRKRALGLSASVLEGLRASRFSGATLVLPLDLTDLQSKDIALLIARWRAAKRRVTANRIGNRASTPLILPRFLYPSARLISGEVGLRDLVAALTQQSRTLVELPSAVRDADTSQDLHRARRKAWSRRR